jgi:hypothetical protein
MSQEDAREGRSAMFRIAWLALAAVAFSPAPDPVDEAIAAFSERMASNADTNARVNAIAEIALRRDPRVAAVLKPLLSDRVVEIRVAAAASIGEQKDPATAALLCGLYDKEADRKERDVRFLCALLEGIGEADAKGRYKILDKAARKWSDVDLEICRAAARSMALAKTPEAVGDLVALAERCDSMIPFQTSDAWKDAYEATAKFVMGELSKLTGKDIKTSKAWREWWKDHGKGWKPGGAADAPADPDAWGDDAGTFALKRPSKSWNRIAVDRTDNWLFVAEARVDGAVAAKIWIRTADVSGLASQTASAMAAEKKPEIEGMMKDVKKEQTRWGAKTSLGGENAVLHEVFGRHPDFDTCFVRYVYSVHGGVMYFVRGMCKGGRDEPLRKEFDGLFASFRFRGK